MCYHLEFSSLLREVDGKGFMRNSVVLYRGIMHS